MSAIVRLDYDHNMPPGGIVRATPLGAWTPRYNGMGSNAAQYFDEEPLVPAQRPQRDSGGGRWDRWKWMVFVQWLAIIGLAVGLILVATTHNHAPTPAPVVRSVPVDGHFEPSRVAPAKSYKFNIAGVYSRYPAEGGHVKDLVAKDVHKAQCCCMYKMTGKTVRETDTCTDLGSTRNPLLHFQIKESDGRTLDANGSYLIVDAGKELLGARCTLTWV